MYLTVGWEKQSNFTEKDISKISEEIKGVYLIWAKGKYFLPISETYSQTITNPMVYVGSGEIRKRLNKHLASEDTVMQLQKQYRLNDLRFTYAAIEDDNADELKKKLEGTENYLAYVFRPIYRKGANYPNEIPREIKLPTQEPDKLNIWGIPYIPSSYSTADSVYWDAYTSMFEKWAKEQHREEDYVEPQK